MMDNEPVKVNACQTNLRTPEGRQAFTELMDAAIKKIEEFRIAAEKLGEVVDFDIDPDE